MITETVTPPPTTRTPSTTEYLLRVAVGPLVFALVMWAPVALPYGGHVTLATFAWAAAWWIAELRPRASETQRLGVVLCVPESLRHRDCDLILNI